MRKMLIAAALALAAVVSLAAQAKPGPIVDKVIFDVRMDQTIATKDTIEGKTDMFFQEVPSTVYRQLSDADKAKIEVYTVPSLTWALQFNPVPNKAPYVWTTPEGKTSFNPLAIREIRYAMNWLIDRKKIVDEICLGDAEPMFTMGTPGQPGTYRYNLISAQLGMTARGNEKRAVADIETAMQAASKLPENVGKLVKSGQWWTYAGDPVTLKFLIRVDDPQGRLPAGRYIADQIEKSGIKVERLEYDRSKCINFLNGNPADLNWHIYTEGWGAGATRAWWANIVAQNYAPYFGNMPGGADTANWNYENKEIDELVEPMNNNMFLTEKEYWDKLLKATKLGLQESVRIYLTAINGRFVVNKARVQGRIPYGLGDGLNEWSIRAADVVPDASGPNKGLKVLRVTQFSAKGSLFMFAWDPVGDNGFSDSYAQSIMRPCTDTATFEAPNTALTTALRATYDVKKMQTKVVAGKDGAPVGQVPVPANAVMFDTMSKTWKKVVPGLTAFTAGTSGYVWGTWHDGSAISFADMMYGTAFNYDWSFQDGEDDKYYDSSLGSIYAEALKLNKGFVVDAKNRTVTTYVDAHFPMEPARAQPVLSPQAANPGYNAVVPWQIYEALGQLVAEGSKSGTVYTFQYSDDAALTEVDVKDEKCVADIKAKLEELLARKFVPTCIKDFATVDEAVSRYKSAIAFIDKYKHAYISNGPFYISKIDPVANYVELSAFRDYPYKSDYWPKQLSMDLSSVDSVKIPAMADRKKDIAIEIQASSYRYPQVAKAPLAKGKVTASLQLADGSEKVYTAKMSKAGSFLVTIPVKDISGLKAGSYTLVVQSQIGTEAPSVSAETLILM